MNTQATAAMVRKRIYNVVPSATWQMEQLLGLLSIEMDDAIPTACVDCRSSPRLRLNPSFVAEHCQSDEHLLMLVLHELHHVALGHTRLFPLVTKLHNIAFDAVINAMLCRQFSDSVYTSFFTGLNSAAEFPSRLLRPPEGWPEKSVYPADLSAAERMVMDLLYTDADGSITYLEVFELLVDALAKLAQAGGAKFVLIGSHGDGRNIGKDPLFQKAIDAIIANWPRPKRDLASRDQGASPLDWQLDPRGRPPASARAVLRRLLHRCGVTAYSPREHRVFSQTTTARTIETVLPHPRDRRAPAWQAIHGSRPVFYRDTLIERRKRFEPQDIVHVYLDVSGSMADYQNDLAAILEPHHRSGQIRLYVFSTLVEEIAPRDIKSTFQNTRGTDLNAVLEHLASLPVPKRPRRVLLLTDGYVGEPMAAHCDALKKIRFMAGITPEGCRSHLEKLNTYMEELPL